MKDFLRFLRKTFVNGLLFLVPFVALIIVLDKAFEIAQKFMDPVAKLTPAHPIFGLEMRVLLAVGLLVLFCFLTGLFAQTTPAQRFIGRLEGAILSKVPGYEYFKNEIESSLGDEERVTYPVVLANVGSVWRFGLQIEAIENGLVAVFIPGAPNPKSGGVFFMTPDRVKPTGLPLASTMVCLRRHGAGSNALLRNVSLG
jgi:uncharacterized membrane protein